MINLNKITEKYNTLCKTPSDIYQLLPHLFRYAKKCKHITEMGVRTPTSSYAFLSSSPDKLISYDISRSPGVDELEQLAPGVFEFVLKDVLEAEIEETDFLFIDTYHTANQLEKELLRHSGKVRKYIGFHDTYIFWEVGEEPYAGINEDAVTNKGLRYAIEPFLAKGGWTIAFMTDKNNGLLIIEREAEGGPGREQLMAHRRYKRYLQLRVLRDFGKNITTGFRKLRRRVKSDIKKQFKKAFGS
jgi:hypothetical protein